MDQGEGSAGWQASGRIGSPAWNGLRDIPFGPVDDQIAADQPAGE